MNKMIVLLVAVFMAVMAGFFGCESSVEVVDGDSDVVLDGDESVIDGDNFEEENIDGDFDIFDIIDYVDPEPEVEENIDGDDAEDFEDIEEVDGDIEEIDEKVDNIDPVGCTTHEECNDYLWCTGAEWCDSGVCIHGYPLGERCGETYCNENAQACTECLEDSHCDGGICNGNGVCVECRENADCPEDNNSYTIAVCKSSGVCGFIAGCYEDADCPEDGHGWTVAHCFNDICEQRIECEGAVIFTDGVNISAYAVYTIKKVGDAYRVNNQTMVDWYPPFDDIIHTPEGGCVIAEFSYIEGMPSNTRYSVEGEIWRIEPKLLNPLIPLPSHVSSLYGFVSWWIPGYE